VDTFKHHSWNIGILMSFVIRRLHFALNWLLSCGESWSKLDGGADRFPLATSGAPPHRAAEVDPMDGARLRVETR
jgi:hypothetical protein